MMSASGSASDILSLGFEDKLLVSPVYQRAQRSGPGYELSDASVNCIYGGLGDKEQSLRQPTRRADPSMQRAPVMMSENYAPSTISREKPAVGDQAFDVEAYHTASPVPKTHRVNSTAVDGQPGLIPVGIKSSPSSLHEQTLSFPTNGSLGRYLRAEGNPLSSNDRSHPERCILSLGELSLSFFYEFANKLV